MVASGHDGRRPAFGGGVVLFGMAGSFWLAFAVICCIGAATTIYQSLSNTLALTMSDDAHQGRVQSLMQLAFAGFGIAALPLGGLAEWLGLRPTIMLMGTVASLAMVTFAVLEGGWRGLRPQGGTDQTAETVERDTATDASTTLEDDGRLVGTPAAGS